MGRWEGSRSILGFSAVLLVLLFIAAGSLIISQEIDGLNTSFILWITPWGRVVGVDLFPINYIPGVVVAYDVECGLCTATLRSWANYSLSLIERLYEKHSEIFVGFFRGEVLSVMDLEGISRQDL